MRILPNRFLLLMILEFVTVLSDIPGAFLRVTQYCPESLSEFGEILLLTNLGETSAFAVCRGREYRFRPISGPVYRLRFRHSGDPDKDCLSTLTLEENYTVQVNIPENEDLVTSQAETKIIRCPKKPHRPPQRLIVSNSEDLVFQSNVSAPAQNESKLNDFRLLYDDMMITDEPEPNVQISIQVQELADSPNIARLQIYSLVNNPHIGANGVSPIKCDISDNTGIKVIIDNGCSNGSVMPINDGFTVQGIMSRSPAFKFPIPSDCSSLITCSFGACKGNCDGSSCRHDNVDITRVYHASAKVLLTSSCGVVRESVHNPKDVEMQVISGVIPSLANNPMDEENTTTHRPISDMGTTNVPLIIALSVLVPITCILFITTCWYRSKVNFGAYRVRTREDPRTPNTVFCHI